MTLCLGAEQQVLPPSLGGSLAPNGESFVALSRQAMTIYSLPCVSHQRTFDHAEADCQESWNPAIFIHNGCALLEGRRGRAVIWDISTATPLTPDIPLEGMSEYLTGVYHLKRNRRRRVYRLLSGALITVSKLSMLISHTATL